MESDDDPFQDSDEKEEKKEETTENNLEKEGIKYVNCFKYLNNDTKFCIKIALKQTKMPTLN
jgi:hypothetical protein